MVKQKWNDRRSAKSDTKMIYKRQAYLSARKLSQDHTTFSSVVNHKSLLVQESMIHNSYEILIAKGAVLTLLEVEKGQLRYFEKRININEGMWVYVVQVILQM